MYDQLHGYIEHFPDNFFVAFVRRPDRKLRNHGNDGNHGNHEKSS